MRARLTFAFLDMLPWGMWPTGGQPADNPGASQRQAIQPANGNAPETTRNNPHNSCCCATLFMLGESITILHNYVHIA